MNVRGTDQSPPKHADIAHAKLSAGSVQPETIDAGAYACPMHPEMVRANAGACPVCGMSLEIRRAHLREESPPELGELTRRFKASLLLTAGILLLGIPESIPAWPFEGFLPP